MNVLNIASCRGKTLTFFVMTFLSRRNARLQSSPNRPQAAWMRRSLALLTPTIRALNPLRAIVTPIEDSPLEAPRMRAWCPTEASDEHPYRGFAARCAQNASVVLNRSIRRAPLSSNAVTYTNVPRKTSRTQNNESLFDTIPMIDEDKNKADVFTIDDEGQV